LHEEGETYAPQVIAYSQDCQPNTGVSLPGIVIEKKKLKRKSKPE
jgi:hypothetical protein